jgi:DNA-binding NtrC family response regulator
VERVSPGDGDGGGAEGGWGEDGTMSKPRVLIIEDDPDGCRSVAEAVEDADCEAVTATTGEQGVRRFMEGGFDVVLSDLMLPGIDGLEVLRRIRKVNKDVPVLIMTAYGTVSSAVDALKTGAYDYVTKPLDLDDLQSTILRSVETRRLRSEVARLKHAVKERYSAESMVARSVPMQDVLRRIESLRDTNATVLIEGESGVGKELVARALHVDGRRASGPFVAVNCAAFSDTLLDSELFGHEKGSFTGATQMRKGAFERADGGTLFLDEVVDAPLSVQSKLLRVLEEREILRLGGQEPIRVDVRLVSATNKDIEEAVGTGGFREDLLYRLKVITVRVPPLRERREDIRPLADRFIAMACEEHGSEVTEVEEGYYEVLEQGDWPGNVRQLRNVVESSVLMASGPVLRAADARADERPSRGGDGLVVPDGMSFAELEREILTQVLGRYKGNRTLVAEKLGLSRRTIQRKIQELGLPF